VRRQSAHWSTGLGKQTGIDYRPWLTRLRGAVPLRLRNRTVFILALRAYREAGCKRS
jgi:hypothetical protein